MKASMQSRFGEGTQRSFCVRREGNSVQKRRMAQIFDQLLDATIQQLKEMKSRGIRYVPVTEAALAMATTTPIRRSHRVAVAPAVARTPMSHPETAPVPTSSPINMPKSSTNTSPSVPDQASALLALRKKVIVCQKCAHLVRSRKSVVFGVGDPTSPLMFVGEAPGADEDIQGEPFVGKAGQLLTKIIQAMGFSRETVYIANILKCRPDTPGQTSGNRKPTPEEMQTCMPHLLAQIEIIKPKVIVGLGVTAVEGLLGRPVSITKLRGNFQEFQGIPLMPTYHPAYLLRNQSMATKREVWEDMLQVMERLQLPISAKQRAYFLAKPQE